MVRRPLSTVDIAPSTQDCAAVISLVGMRGRRPRIEILITIWLCAIAFGFESKEKFRRRILPIDLHKKKSPEIADKLSLASPHELLYQAVMVRGGGPGVLHSLSSTKSGCWAILLVSIMVETYATTLSKYARDRSSQILLVLSLSLYLTRCVTQSV